MNLRNGLAILMLLIFGLCAQSAEAKGTSKKMVAASKAKTLELLDGIDLPHIDSVRSLTCSKTSKSRYCEAIKRAKNYNKRGKHQLGLAQAARALSLKVRSREALGLVGLGLMHTSGCPAARPYLRLAADSKRIASKATKDFIHCADMSDQLSPDTLRAKRLALVLANQGNAWAAFRSASFAIQDGKHNHARQLVKSALRLKPTADSHKSAASVFYEMGEFETAIGHVDMALKLEKDDGKRANLYERKANYQIDLGDLEGAKASVEAALALGSTFAKGYEIALSFELLQPLGEEEAKEPGASSTFAFHQALATGRGKSISEDVRANLGQFDKFALAIMNGDFRPDELLTQATAYNYSDEVNDWGQFILGRCGPRSKASPLSYRAEVLGLYTNTQWIEHWRRRCGHPPLSTKVNLNGQSREHQRERELAWAASVMAGRQDRGALEIVAQLEEHDSRELRQLAMLVYAEFGNRKMVEKIESTLGFYTRYRVDLSFAKVLASVTAGELELAKRDFAAVPAIRKIQAFHPFQVVILAKIVERAAHLDPVFARELYDTFFLIDGPLEQKALRAIEASQ